MVVDGYFKEKLSYLLKYDLSKNELYKYFEKSDEMEYISSIFDINEYLYVVESSNTGNETQIKITRINTIDDIAYKVYNVNESITSSKLFPWGGGRSVDNKLLFMLNFKYYLSDYDLREYTELVLANKSNVSVGDCRIYKNNIYYSLYDKTTDNKLNTLYKLENINCYLYKHKKTYLLYQIFACEYILYLNDSCNFRQHKCVFFHYH